MNGLKYELQNDFTLIKLNAPVTLTNFTQPICLPEADDRLQPGSECYSMGWGETRGTGYSSLLKQLKLVVQAPDVCEQRHEAGEKFDSASMICAKASQHGHSPCSGDSGTPLGIISITLN